MPLNGQGNGLLGIETLTRDEIQAILDRARDRKSVV